LQALDRLRSRLGLDRRAQLDEWLATNQLDMDMLDALMSDEALVEQAAAAQAGAEIAGQMVHLLKLSGRYCGLAARAASKAASLSADDAIASAPPPPVLLSWYGQRHDDVSLGNLDGLVADLGLASRQELYRLLAREYLYLQATAPQQPDST
jgi:hypothetical protein